MKKTLVFMLVFSQFSQSFCGEERIQKMFTDFGLISEGESYNAIPKDQKLERAVQKLKNTKYSDVGKNGYMALVKMLIYFDDEFDIPDNGWFSEVKYSGFSYDCPSIYKNKISKNYHIESRFEKTFLLVRSLYEKYSLDSDFKEKIYGDMVKKYIKKLYGKPLFDMIKSSPNYNSEKILEFIIKYHGKDFKYRSDSKFNLIHELSQMGIPDVQKMIDQDPYLKKVLDKLLLERSFLAKPYFLLAALIPAITDIEFINNHPKIFGFMTYLATAGTIATLGAFAYKKFYGKESNEQDEDCDDCEEMTLDEVDPGQGAVII